ncbi:MAG: hypothetical protein AB7H97_02105 [Pseudobdellovibrionaceae bacterium]
MQLIVGERRARIEIPTARLPKEIGEAISVESSSRLDVTLPSYAGRASEPTAIDLATERDLNSIVALISKFPDTAQSASEKGFLRGRFTREEYRKLIKDKCLHVVHENGEVVAFASVLPWNHQMLSLERAVVSLKIGPLKIQLCRWTSKDYANIVESEPILYIADAAVSPESPHAVVKLIDGLAKLRSQNPNSYIVTTSSEAPLPNAHSAQFLKRIGFERIGYVWLPARPMSVGEYPGRTKIIFPFQSGIWVIEPEKVGV